MISFTLLFNLVKCCLIYLCILLPGFLRQLLSLGFQPMGSVDIISLTSNFVLCASSRKAHLVTATIPIERVILHHCSFKRFSCCFNYFDCPLLSSTRSDFHLLLLELFSKLTFWQIFYELSAPRIVLYMFKPESRIYIRNQIGSALVHCRYIDCAYRSA